MPGKNNTTVVRKLGSSEPEPEPEPICPPIMGIEEWARKNGRRITTPTVDGHIHAYLRSKPQTKTFDRWSTKEFNRLREERDRTERDYQAAIDRGEIREAKGFEELERRALYGHPDNLSVQASYRVVHKREQVLNRGTLDTHFDLRFSLYCISKELSEEEMLEIESELYPDYPLTGYIVWSRKKWREYDEKISSKGESKDFDEWLADNL